MLFTPWILSANIVILISVAAISLQYDNFSNDATSSERKTYYISSLVFAITMLSLLLSLRETVILSE